MNPFTLLYIFYGAKVGSQASIYFIWLKDSSSETIAFMAAGVAILAIVPFFHVIVNVCSTKPLSNSTFTAYLCLSFLLAFLWYKPTQDGDQRVLPFALVTTVDLLALLVFLFKKQIGHWHSILILDTEKGHPEVGNVDDPPVSSKGRGNEDVEHRDFGTRPKTTQNEMRQTQEDQELNYNIDAINGGLVAGSRGLGQRLESGTFASAGVAVQQPFDVRLGTGIVQSMSEAEVMEESQMDPGFRHQGQNEFFIDQGTDMGAGSGNENFHHSKERPTTTYSNIHPALRPNFDVTSRPPSSNVF